MHYYLILSFVPFLFCMLLLVLSCIGRWLIFISAGHKGFLSLIPVVNLFVYGDISGRKKSAFGIFLSMIGLSLFSAVLGNVYRLTEDSPGVRGKAALICLFVIGALIFTALVLYIRLVLGVCSALSLNKPLFITLSILMLPVAEFAAGLVVRKNRTSGIVVEDRVSEESGHSIYSMGQASSLEAFLTGEDRVLALWDSGALIIRDGMVVNTADEVTDG